MITVFMKTYGCQANVADSSHISKYMEGIGFSVMHSEGSDVTPAQVDLVIVNSCAIREKAEQKMFSYLGSLAKLKKEKPYLVVGVIGCVASYRKQEIMNRVPHANFVFSARDDIEDFKAYITDVVESTETAKRLYYTGSADMEGDAFKKEFKKGGLFKRRDKDVLAVVEKKKLKPVPFALLKTEFRGITPHGDTTPRGGTTFERSMINIMRVCNNYCSYCIVPFTTGRERSFSLEQILENVKRDVAAGAKEVTLLGQNVNSYKDPQTGARFETLLERVAQLDGDFWVRFVSAHPKDMTTDVIDVIAENKKLCSYVHLPLQSGSNRILDAMNRTYSAEKYLDQIAYIKKRLPGALLTTDIIVGFPGEEESDYRATMDLVEQVRYNMIFSFIYSPRKYTQAAELEDLCPQNVKLERLQKLQARQREIGTGVNKELVGRQVLVLMEGVLSDGRSWGRTEGNMKVFLAQGTPAIGQFVDVIITQARLSDLQGELVGE